MLDQAVQGTMAAFGFFAGSPVNLRKVDPDQDHARISDLRLGELLALAVSLAVVLAISGGRAARARGFAYWIVLACAFLMVYELCLQDRSKVETDR